MSSCRASVALLVSVFFVSGSAQGYSRACGPLRNYPNAHPVTRRQNQNQNQNRVRYECAIGYTPRRGSPIVECRNGRWSALTLLCERKRCGSAGDISNGYFEYEGEALFGERAFAKCKEGYHLNGVEYRLCSDSGWEGEIPTCEPIGTTVACPTPAVKNTVRTRGEDTSVFRPGDAVSIVCQSGYELQGSQKITCTPDGQWVPALPVCLLTRTVTCSIPEDYTTAHLEDEYQTQRQFFSGDEVRYMCAAGFVAESGSASIVCQNGQWTQLTLNCQRIKAEVTCPTPEVENAVRVNGEYASVFRPGDAVSIVCQSGYELQGSQKITCTPDGRWDPALPVCLPSRTCGSRLLDCGRKNLSMEETHTNTGDCGTPPPYPSMEVVDAHLTQQTFKHGSRVKYRCILGYMRSRGKTPFSYCKNGIWTQVDMECEQKSCGSAGEILHGRYKYEGSSFGDKAFAVCNDGYQVVGRNYRQCLDMGWDGREPVCEAVTCGNPPVVVGGEWRSPWEGPFKYGAVVTYHCYQGELIGKSELHCTRKGTWSGPAPQCKEITCPNVMVDNGEKISGFGIRFKFRNAVSFTCKRGYVLHGPSTVVCSANGQWKPKPPRCVPKKCPEFTIHNGRKNTNRLAYGTKVDIDCNGGFMLVGPKTMFCLASGTWCSYHCEDCNCPGVYSPQCVRRR